MVPARDLGIETPFTKELDSRLTCGLADIGTMSRVSFANGKTGSLETTIHGLRDWIAPACLTMHLILLVALAAAVVYESLASHLSQALSFPSQTRIALGAAFVCMAWNDVQARCVAVDVLRIIGIRNNHGPK